jgi:hypothetical protein
MDERLKSIVATQIGSLLTGGYGLELVQRVAIATALSWDERRGHNRLTHLAQRIRLIDAGEALERHKQQKAEQGQLDPRVARALSPARPARPHPNSHAFVRGDEPNTCAVPDCGGPVGVHVRLVTIDDDGAATVVPTGVAP